MWYGVASWPAGHLVLLMAGGFWQEELRVSLCRCPQGIPALQECNPTNDTVCRQSASSKTGLFLITMTIFLLNENLHTIALTVSK